MKNKSKLKDSNGVPRIIKRFVALIIAWIATPYFYILNRLTLRGREILKSLPRENVLFISNHLTYFMDGIGFLYYCSVQLQPKFLRRLWLPDIGNKYFVIAMETSKMKGFLIRLINLGGAIAIDRTWKKDKSTIKDEKKNMESVMKDQEKIGNGLMDGWVLIYPQGTTTPFAPARKGVAKIIKKYKPVVVPVVVSGFSKAFHRSKPFVTREKKTDLLIRVKEPLNLNYESSTEEITNQVLESIEQSETYQIEYESKDLSIIN